MNQFNAENKPEYGVRVIVQIKDFQELQIWRLEPDEEFGEVWMDDDNNIYLKDSVILWQMLPEALIKKPEQADIPERFDSGFVHEEAGEVPDLTLIDRNIIPEGISEEEFQEKLRKGEPVLLRFPSGKIENHIAFLKNKSNEESLEQQ